jgi:AAA15 family ATPase/GTPase
MNHINSIEINNFRGFEKFHIDDFNQINILIGKNNSGKSSILEAIFLTVGMSNAVLPNVINQMRGLNIRTADEFKYLFHKLKFTNVPEFTCKYEESSERTLKLNPIYDKSLETESNNSRPFKDDFSLDTSTASPNVTGLELAFSLKKRNNSRKTFKSSIHINQQNFLPNISNNYKEELNAVYINGDSKEGNALTRYSEIVKRKKGDIVLEALKKIDPNIESIHPLPDGLFFGYKSIEELVPTNISGDGVRRYLNIVTSIVERPNSIVLIDEIENGLHYSAHKMLWKSILNISIEFNVQLFITSHNLETLECLQELLNEEEYQKHQKLLNIYSVAHTKTAGIKTYKYSYRGFKDAIDTETEIR